MRPLRVTSLLLLLPLNLQAQAAGAPTQHPTVRATVHLVLEDVVVTDKHGNAVPNLSPMDFVIFENGKRQKIISFEFNQPPIVSNTTVQTMKPPGATDLVKTPSYKSETSRTNIVLDALNTPWPDQAYARRKMLEFAKKQLRDQRIAVYGLTSSLFLIQNFTSNPDLLRHALEKSPSQRTTLSSDNPEKNIELPTENLPETVSAIRRMELDQERFRLDERVNVTLTALQQLARSVAVYPQRKNLVWLTGGFPIDLYHNLEAILKAGDTMDKAVNQMVSYSERIKQTADALASAHVAVYPVDARALLTGLIGDPLFNGGTHVGVAQPGLPSQMTPDQSVYRSAEISAPQQTMLEMADETGGRAFVNANDIGRAVALAMADGSSYYRLGYYPDDVALKNAEFRKIEIKMNRRGVKARYRRGYYICDNCDGLPAQ